MNVACILVVLAAVLFRIGWTRTVSSGPRAVAAIGSAAIAFAVVAWMVVEPMRPGGPRKAGTPTRSSPPRDTSRSGGDGVAGPVLEHDDRHADRCGGANGGVGDGHDPRRAGRREQCACSAS